MSVELDDVLDWFTDDCGEVCTQPKIEKWVKDFPQFEKEIREFAAAWQYMDTTPACREFTQQEKENLEKRGEEIVNRLIKRATNKSSVMMNHIGEDPPYCCTPFLRDSCKCSCHRYT